MKYQVIYAYGAIEVPSIRTHDNREDAQAELEYARYDELPPDDAWIEPVTTADQEN